MKKSVILDQLEVPVYYQSTARNNGKRFKVTVISVSNFVVTVETQGEIKERFKCKLSSLSNE